MPGGYQTEGYYKQTKSGNDYSDAGLLAAFILIGICAYIGFLWVGYTTNTIQYFAAVPILVGIAYGLFLLLRAGIWKYWKIRDEWDYDKNEK